MKYLFLFFLTTGWIQLAQGSDFFVEYKPNADNPLELGCKALPGDTSIDSIKINIYPNSTSDDIAFKANAIRAQKALKEGQELLNCKFIKRLEVGLSPGKYDFSNINAINDQTGYNAKLSIHKPNVTIKGLSDTEPSILFYSGTGSDKRIGHGRVIIIIGKLAHNATLQNLKFTGDHSFEHRSDIEYYRHESKALSYGMIMVGESPNMISQPKKTLIDNCHFSKINFRGVLINNRSTKIKDSIFEGIASNFEKAMNIEFASNVIAGQIKTAFDDKPGMDFNSGISVRPGLLILKNENDLKILKMKTSGLEITESNSLLENDEIVILRNQFLNLIEGVVGGVFTSYTASEMSERIRSGFKIRVPIFKIQDNFFNTISDHSIYLSGRFEQSLIEYNAFYRSQSVVIKITGINEIDEALVPHKSASESMNQGMYPGAVSSHVIRNTFAWTPNMALTLSGLGNRISENIILRYHSECEKREQLYKPIDPILGIYPHFLLYTLLSGDSRSGYAQSNLILNNKMIDDFSLLDDSWANSLLKSTILQAHICNNPVSNGVEDTERLIAVVYQHPGSKKTAYSNIFSGKGQEGFLWFSAGISPAPFTHAMRTVQKSGKNCPEDPSLVFENCTPLFAFQRKSSNGIPLRLGFLSEESPNGDDQYTRDVKKLEIRNRSDIIE